MSKEKQIDKLRKLLALANGTSNEAEAMAAIGMAQAYAELHGLNLNDVSTQAKLNDAEKEYGMGPVMYSGKRHADNRLQWQPVDFYLWKPLAYFCNVKVRVCVDEDGDNALQYFGHEVDVELAQYLRRVINKAMAFEWGALVLGMDDDANPDMQRTIAAKDKAIKRQLELRHSFFEGMASRLRERMIDVRADRAKGQPKVTGDGKALAVIKDEMMDRRAKAVGFVEAQGAAGKHYSHDASMYATGRERGGAVDLGRGVGGSSVKMIGR